jgi:hypothetical protein
MKINYKQHDNAMIKHVLLSICYIIFALFVNSCAQDLTIEIKTNDKRLLVNGEFTSDSAIHTTQLYCSGSLITGHPQTIISGAKIYITDKVDTFYYNESNTTPGLYETSKKCCGIAGRTYYLSISNIDVDTDGKMDSYVAQSIMPVPVHMDSIKSVRGLHPNDKTKGINNYEYFTVSYNGPDYFYKFLEVTGKISYGTIADRLGSGEISSMENELKLPKVYYPDSVIKQSTYLQATNSVVNGDTISFVIYNLTQKQFEFLEEFDNNTYTDPFIDNIYDKLKVPTNLPTNIEPSDKAAGFFFIYSTSSISKVFHE